AGDRVAYLAGERGSYATHGIAAAARTVKVPDDVALEVVAATLLKGCTVEVLVERCARVQPGNTTLVHAAAGGVGMLLVGWLKSVGATVIAHAGSAEKAALAKQLGADHVLHCPFPELAE